MRKIILAALLKNYKSRWVAISEDFTKVVFSGKTLKEVRKKAGNRKNKIYFFRLENHTINLLDKDN